MCGNAQLSGRWVARNWASPQKRTGPASLFLGKIAPFPVLPRETKLLFSARRSHAFISSLGWKPVAAGFLGGPSVCAGRGDFLERAKTTAKRACEPTVPASVVIRQSFVRPVFFLPQCSVGVLADGPPRPMLWVAKLTQSAPSTKTPNKKIANDELRIFFIKSAAIFWARLDHKAAPEVSKNLNGPSPCQMTGAANFFPRGSENGSRGPSKYCF